MINTHHNLRELRFEFQQNGIITIDNWLQEDYANTLYKHLFDMPRDWWSISTYPAFEQEYCIVPDVDEHQEYINKSIKLARQAFHNGEFSYIFKRTKDNHVEECECPECKFREDLISKEVLTFLQYITDFELDKIYELFASYFDKGHFLSPHNDGPNGNVGFVYNLSVGWRPEYGGNLFFVDNDNWLTIDKVNVPTFNSLTLFDLATSQGNMHFVSEVIDNAPVKRLAVTGWLGSSKRNPEQPRWTNVDE